MNIISNYAMRPKRTIFYMDTSTEDIANYYKGIVPEKVAKYNGAFGTYGYPGLFSIRENGQWLKVIGIEFRPDDDRISYPQELNCIYLDNTFFRVDAIIDEADEVLDDNTIMEYVRDSCIEDSLYISAVGAQIKINQNPEIIQVFLVNGHCSVMISGEYEQTRNATEDPGSDEPMYKNLFYHDPTTGYYNWNYIWPRMSGYHLYGIQDYAFVYFDIKDFNAVNVVFGHMAANDLLKKITSEMDKLDWAYCCARTDNDNFAMMIKDMPKEETCEKLEKFFESVSYLKEDKNYRVCYRCGVVPMRITMEMGGIVADAGKQAKAFGTTPFKTEIIFYSEAMREEQEISIRLRTYLDTAIERDEFMVYLQPKYDIQTEKVKGAEALIRWNYKGREMLSPGQFVPIFEACGLISKLDDIVLGKVCEKLKEWEEMGKNLYPVSVNVSRKSLGVPNLVEHLTKIVDSYGVDHSLIDFELTESAANDNQEMMINVISDFSEHGFNTSMDDFGTGYSSLSLLPIMHFDTLKIDKSFVDGIGTSKESQRSCCVIKQIIVLAKELNLVCLAEGAEEKEQVDLLRDFGCEVIQGYYYSRPLPMEEYEKLI